MVSVKVLLSLVLIIVWSVLCSAETMIARKITLGRFKVKNGSIIDLPKSSPDWPQVDKHIITADDKGNIYVLNLWHDEIISFDSRGKLRKKIRLQFKFTRADYQNGYLEVSGDGKKFFVIGYDELGRPMQFAFNEHGRINRVFSGDEAWNFPDRRLCDRPYYLFSKGSILYDENFKQIEEPFLGFADSEGKYKVDVHKRLLIKSSKDGKKLWGKQFTGHFGIIGVDANDYVYIHGILREGESDSLYKLNSNGEIVAWAPIPDPFPLLTPKEKDEWERHASEDPLSFFKLTCNGDVYLIYQLSELPELTLKRWLKSGQYFIYKFESAK